MPGIGLTALVRIKVGPGTEIGSLAGEFAGWDGVECVYEISGDADLIGIVHVDDTVALRDLLDRVWLTAPGDITSTQTDSSRISSSLAELPLGVTLQLNIHRLLYQDFERHHHLFLMRIDKTNLDMGAIQDFQQPLAL